MCNREEINEDIKMKEAGENKPIGLETFAYGSVVQATAICLKDDNAEVPPSFWGAENYTANNFNAPAANPQTGEGGIATRFMSMTSRATGSAKAFHGAGDNLAVFGSEVYSGGTGENYTTTPVGGMLVQASHQHEEGKFGSRLVFCYVKTGTSELIPGAILDDDGTFLAGHLQILGELKGEIKHTGEKIGFFNTPPEEKPPVTVVENDLETTVQNLIDALTKLGLISQSKAD